MSYYHVVFNVCMAVQGGPEVCQPEQMIDTRFNGLVSCYSAASTTEKMAIDSAQTQAKAQNIEITALKVNTRCITTREGDDFLEKTGPSGLIITGKKYD